MIHHELIHWRNLILFSIVAIFYTIQVIINIFIEGVASVFPPAFLFILGGGILAGLIIKKVNPFMTMYLMVTSMYLYFYFLLNDSPYLVNYLFMWICLPLSAIYQNYRIVILAGTASIMLTFYSFFSLHAEIFPNVVQEDFIYLVLFGVFSTVFLLVFIRVTIRLWQEADEANAKLQKLAYYDPLTGAANRIFLKQRFDTLKVEQTDSIAVLFIDMNHFKLINDTYGHDAGDYLLEQVVSRIHTTIREADVLCRLGGDEFVILLSNVDNAMVENVVERIRATLAEPVKIDDTRIIASASIGSSFTTEVNQADLEAMMKQADDAMYKEKERGKVIS